MDEILSRLMHPDSCSVRQATVELNEKFKADPEAAAIGLCQVMTDRNKTASEDRRKFAALLLRKRSTGGTKGIFCFIKFYSLPPLFIADLARIAFGVVFHFLPANPSNPFS